MLAIALLAFIVELKCRIVEASMEVYVSDYEVELSGLSLGAVDIYIAKADKGTVDASSEEHPVLMWEKDNTTVHASSEQQTDG